MVWLLLLLLVGIIVLARLGQQAAQADWGGKQINKLDGLVRLLCKYLHHLPDTRIPLPEQGAAIVVANHVSGLDPLLLVAASERPLRFLIAREEYERPVLNRLFKAAGCIPVDRTGKSETALRQALKALKDGEVIALFPHGKIHLDSDPPRPLKGGVARLASWSGATIYPVRIDDVRCEGQVFLAPFIPSHTRLTLAKPIEPDEQTVSSLLHAIKVSIER